MLADRILLLRQASATPLIAMQWEPPSGLVVMHLYATLEAVGPVAQITMLLMSEEDRRRGIGQLLIKGAAQAARTAGCDQLEITTTPGAPSLGAFCRATGFAEAGHAADQVSVGVAAIDQAAAQLLNRPGVADDIPAHGSFLKTSTAFTPPKPNELESATLISAGRATFGT